jgi:hypothetical protein
MILKRCRHFLMLILGTLALSVGVRADDLPKSFDFIRYESITKKSPFAVATVATPVATAASFAKDLYIANAAHSPDGDLVTIASSADKGFKKYLTTNEPADGYSISSIEWSDRVGETKVTIAKDGQFATLTFNQALLSQPMANAPPPQPNPGNQVMTPQPMIRPGQQQPTPIPHSRGVIQRNPRAVGTPNPAADRQLENQ